MVFGLFTLLLLGSFIYLALADAPVQKGQVSKTIANERFFNGH